MAYFRLFLLSVLLHFTIFSFADKTTAINSLPDSVFRQHEKHLSSLAMQIANARFADANLDTLSNELSRALENVLELEGAFHFPFDSLQGLGMVESEDKKLRIFNWNMVYADGSYKYGGIIHYYHKPEKEYLIFHLHDDSDVIDSPEKASLSNENWFGAYYYQIKDVKINKEIVYTLLGWDGNNDFSNKKVIDALRFTSSGKPKFNNSIFKNGRTKTKRVIFEFSYMTSMMLKYDYDYGMIVFEHLSPSKNSYYGNYQFYGPDLSYDAYILEDDFWVLKEDVNYRLKEKKTKFSLFKKSKLKP